MAYDGPGRLKTGHTVQKANLPRLCSYISYSCYDCRDEDSFRKTISLIRKITSTPLIIGEFGIPINKYNSQDSEKYLLGLLKVIKEMHIELFCYWQIFENEFSDDGTIPAGFGVIGPNGMLSGIYFFLRFFIDRL